MDQNQSKSADATKEVEKDEDMKDMHSVKDLAKDQQKSPEPVESTQE